MKKLSLLIVIFSISIHAQVNSVEKIINKADSLIRIDKLIEGEDLLKEILKSDSENLEALNRLFALQFYKKENLNSSLNYLNKICSINPTSQCYSILASLFDETNRIDSALFFNKKAIELDSTNFTSILNLGVIHKNKLKDAEKAFIYYKKAYQIVLNKNYSEAELQYRNEDFGKILYSLGNTSYSFGKYEESNQYFFEGLKYHYDEILMKNGIANNYMRLEKFNEALKFYDQTLKINPDYLYSINEKGNALYKLGNTKEACIYWKQAIDKGYEYKDDWFEEYDIKDPNVLIHENCKNYSTIDN